MKDIREKQGATIRFAPILPKHTKVIATNERFLARSEDGVTEILAELDGLVHKAVAIAQVCALRRSEVNAKALSRPLIFVVTQAEMRSQTAGCRNRAEYKKS